MSEDDGLGRHGIGSMALVLAGLAILGTVLTMDVLIKYLIFGLFKFATPYQVQVEKLRFFTFQAAISGIIVCAGARAFMLRQRDYILACSRPVKGFTLIGAKATASALFVLLIAASYSLPATLTFTLFTSDAAGINPVWMFFSLLGGAAIQTLSILFFMILFLGGLEFLARFKATRILSPLVHGTALMFFISIFFWFPGVYESLLAGHQDPSVILSWWPSAWLAGFPPPVTAGILIALVIILPAVVYFCYLKAALSAFRGGGRQGKPNSRLKERAMELSWPTTFSRFLALVSFFRLTFKRSRRIRSIILFILAAALSLVLVPLAARWTDSGKEAGFTDLLPQLPLLLNVALACALRFCAIQAVESKAAWIFRLNNTAEGHPRLALLTAFFLELLFPLNMLLMGMLALPLGLGAALKLTFFHSSMGLTLAAAIFLNTSWMPFSTQGVSDEEGVKLAAVRWLLGVLLYYWIMRALGDLVLVKDPAALFLIAAPMFMAVIMVIVLYLRDRVTVLLFKADF